MGKKIDDLELKEIYGGCRLVEFLNEKGVSTRRLPGNLPELRKADFPCSDDGGNGDDELGDGPGNGNGGVTPPGEEENGDDGTGGGSA